VLEKYRADGRNATIPADVGKSLESCLRIVQAGHSAVIGHAQIQLSAVAVRKCDDLACDTLGIVYLPLELPNLAFATDNIRQYVDLVVHLITHEDILGGLCDGISILTTKTAKELRCWGAREHGS
jgi:hypothetical protein